MTLEELKVKMGIFEGLHYIHFPEEGHLVWRYETGNNVEILDMEAYKKRQGIGRKLIRRLVNDLDKNPPYSIFGFTREINEDAQAFYKAMGFELTPVIRNFYRFGGVLFIALYKKIRDI